MRNIRRAGDYWKRILSKSETIYYELFEQSENITKEIKKNIFEKYVEIVNIETSTKCNRKCLYCPLSEYERGKNQNYMEEELFNKIISDLASINYRGTISLNIYNEPLLDKTIYEKILKIKKNLPETYIMFNSNGDYLDIEVLEKLNKIETNAIFITLHTLNNYDDDIQLQKIKEFIKKIKIKEEKINIIPQKSMIMETNYKNIKLKIMSNNWGEYGNDRAGTVKILKKDNKRINPCMRPIREFTIYQDGSVYPCCQFFPDNKILEKFKIGNMKEDDIFDIYSSKSASNFRRKLFIFGEKEFPCSGCMDEDNSEKSSELFRIEIINNCKKE